MTRSILAALAAVVSVTIVTGTGCNSSGVGDPCTPEAEYDPGFLGFSSGEVNLESKSFQCQTRLCLANHFQGRATCPYGQSAPSGNPPAATAFDQTQGTSGCITPIGLQVTGEENGVGAVQTPPASPPYSGTAGEVLPNCEDRTAANAVYCSCRCANPDGQTNDGAVYCNCPTGFTCTQLVSAVSSTLDVNLQGAYCVKDNTQYDSSTSCSTLCTAKAGGCGTAQGVAK
jgi:hypothetical protein